MARRRVAVLISGSGSNLQALIDRSREDDASFDIVQVISNVADAFGLERARQADIPARVVDHRAFEDRTGFDRAIGSALGEGGAEIVCLAGFMRILGTELVEAWADRMLNIHPALLPSFKGLHTHERALAAGVRMHGCTVHVVRPALDDGPIVVQGVVPVLPDDDVAVLGRRVMEVEHRAYPLALDLLSTGKAEITGETVRVSSGCSTLILHPSLS